MAGYNKECPNKSARFKVRAIVVLLGWRQWKFNICHLWLLRLVVMERYTKEQRVIIAKTRYNMGKIMRKQFAKCHLTQWPSELATEVVRFDTVRLLSLGGFVKFRVYANKPQTIPELKAEIRGVIGETEPQLCGNVTENFVKRAIVCQQSRVGDICRILCSTINRSVCTLYWNRNNSTLFVFTDIFLSVWVSETVQWRPC